MTNFQFLQNYEKLQSGIMIDKFVELGFATVSFCQGDTSGFWNHALTDQVLDTDSLGKVEETLRPRCFTFLKKRLEKRLKKSIGY